MLRSLQPVAATSRRLFLVRHGEVIPPGGVHGVHYGNMDVPLSPLGEAEARAAAEALKTFELDGVYSSPLKRAVYGADRIRDGRSGMRCCSTMPKTLNGFSELDRGDWRGKSKEDIGIDLYEAFNRCKPGSTPANGESLAEIKQRVLEARDSVLESVPEGCSAAVVSHLWVTRSMVSDAMGIDTSEMVDIGIPTASISCIDYSEDGSQSVVFTGFKPATEAGLAKSQDLGN